jgi:TolB-like protein/Tfp pilus assembly protein PilF
MFLMVVWRVESPRLIPAEPILAKAVAVLPFEDLTQDKELSFFSTGLSDAINDALLRSGQWTVIATGSAKINSDNLSELGSQLGVSHLILGSVQKQGEQLRIRASLIATESGQQLWSEIFTRTLGDVFLLHDDIANSIAERGFGIGSLHMEQRPTQSQATSQAYLAVMRGQEHIRTSNYQAALTQFETVLATEPNYVPALAGLANATWRLATIGEINRESGFAKALSLATQVTELDPNNVEALLQIAEIQHRHFWNFPAAHASFERALQAAPSHAQAHAAYGRFLSKAGQLEESVTQAQTALKLDPLSPKAANSLAIRLLRAGREEGARNMIDKLKRNHPKDPNIPWLEANWFLSQGDYQSAFEWGTLEEYEYLRLSLTAIALHHLGRTTQAETSLNELITNDSQGAAFQIAEVYAQWNRLDSAFAWLERAFAQGDPGLIELYSSFHFANLYDDPRFQPLAVKVGLPEITPRKPLKKSP